MEFIIINPFGEAPDTWKNELFPASQFFLSNDSQPLIIGDLWELGIFYNGKCRGCDKNLAGKKIFCEQCEKKYYNLIPECPSCGRKFEIKDLLTHLFSVYPLSLSEIFSKISKLSHEVLIKSCPNKCDKNLK